MRTTALSLIAALAGAAIAAPALAAPPTPPPVTDARSSGIGQVPVPMKPDVAVKAVWLGSGTGDRFAPLGHSPMVGETISLVCQSAVRGVAPGWKIAWYVDGQKTCGEGQYVIPNPPVCEYAWPLTQGTEAFIDYVPHAAGNHTFACAVDVGNQVDEWSEGNNSKQVSFVAKLPLHPLTPRVLQAVPKPEPFIRHAP